MNNTKGSQRGDVNYLFKKIKSKNPTDLQLVELEKVIKQMNQKKLLMKKLGMNKFDNRKEKF